MKSNPSRKRSSVLRSLAFFGVTAALWAGFGTGALHAEENLIDTIIKRGTIRVGISSFVPWSFRSKTGDYIGFEVDVARKLAEDMGVKLETIPTAWDGIIPALLAKKFDVIIGGMTVTIKRNLQINFTQSYNNELGLGVIANKKKIPLGTTVEQLNDAKYTFAVRRGATAVQAIQRFFPRAKLRQFDDEPIVEQEVLSGNADAMVTSAPKDGYLVEDHPENLFLPLPRTLTQSQTGFGLRRGDADALNVLNNWITTNLYTGWLQERSAYWFNKSRPWKNLAAEKK